MAGNDKGQVAVTREAAPQARPLTVSRDKFVVREAKHVPTRRYHIGLSARCPFWSLDIGGINFPRVNHHVASDGNGGSSRSERRGVIISLTDEQRDRILETVVVKVIGPKGDGQGVKLDTRNATYRPSAQHIPYAAFVWMTELPEGATPSGLMPENQEPACLMEWDIPETLYLSRKKLEERRRAGAA